jgi:hypothetical protein
MQRNKGGEKIVRVLRYKHKHSSGTALFQRVYTVDSVYREVGLKSKRMFYDARLFAYTTNTVAKKNSDFLVIGPMLTSSVCIRQVMVLVIPCTCTCTCTTVCTSCGVCTLQYAYHPPEFYRSVVPVTTTRVHNFHI